MTDIVVVGSLNMDIIVKVDHLPMAVETIHGLTMHKMPGGKGANQATASARLGESVSIVRKVGNDEDGRILRQCLIQNGVDTTWLCQPDEDLTGTAFVIVNKKGDNQIIVLSRANFHVDIALFNKIISSILKSGFLLFQFEIPILTVKYLIDYAHDHGIPIVINPSPLKPLGDDTLRKIDYLILNEIEASSMLEMEITSLDQANDAVKTLFNRGIKHVILTLGQRGAMICEREGFADLVPHFSVDPIDTTGSGDAFLAGCIHGLLNEMPFREAVYFANAVGALTVTKPGAQSSFPYLNEVKDFMQPDYPQVPRMHSDEKILAE